MNYYIRLMLAMAVITVLMSWLEPTLIYADDAGPSLDELLGLPEAKTKTLIDEGDTKLTDDPKSVEIAEQDIEASSLFDQTIGDMQGVAKRMDQLLDPGVVTQRMHESIIDKLDQLIDVAKQQQGSSGGSSSSSGSQRRTSRSGMGQAAGAASVGGAQQGQGGTGAGGQSGQPLTGQRHEDPQAGQSSWGHLPPRIRDELQQGVEEPFSPRYQQLTERYYQRLAEEGRENE